MNEEREKECMMYNETGTVDGQRHGKRQIDRPRERQRQQTRETA